jgi:dTDP-4-dehydrorhamnose reductase
VTGSNGQLGSELKAIASEFDHHNFEFVDIEEMDLMKEASIRDFFKEKHFDFIINCAAYTAVDKAEEDVDAAFAINSEAVKVIAEICSENNIRLIHVSTDYVFDGNGNQPMDENCTPNPLSVYGKSKLEGEKHVQHYLSNAYIIRTAWVYSVYGKNFVKTINALARTREELNVVVDQIGTPTYANDLARVLLTIVDSISSNTIDKPGIYHYSNEGVISWYDLAHFIVKYSKLKCQVRAIRSEEYKTMAIRPKFSAMDKNKLKQTFGVTVPHWHESLVKCLNGLNS